MATQHFLQRFQRPPSPTLTNPDLILPDQSSAARLHTDIPAFRQRPPSPSQILRKVNSTSQFDPAAYARPQSQSHPQPASQRSGSRNGSSATRTPPRSRRSSNLDEHDEQDATPRRSDHLNGDGPPSVIASSPILHEPTKLHAHGYGAGASNKRWSSTSSSVHSDDFESLESLKWPGFDSGADADGDDGIELIDEDEEEQFGSFPDPSSPSAGTRSGDGSRWTDGDDGDPYSPNALSRRADMILANAKKRLNLFEGNLNSARHSLPVAQSMSMASLRAPPDMPSLPTPPRENVNYAGLAGPIDSSNSGHSRGFSEASASSFIQQLLVARQQRKSQPAAQPQRSMSALATHTQQNNHVRNSRSQELMREHRIHSWVFGNEQEPLASPPASETAIGRDSIRRSPSTTNDLRAQMNDLKGKISSLQQRAKDENLRRRSYASLRSQSAASFRNGSPLASEFSRSQVSLRENGVKPAARGGPGNNAADPRAVMPGSFAESQYGDEDDDDAAALERIDNESPEARAMLNETLEELEDQSAYESGDGESVYESVFGDEQVEPAARHEDRADAFDYENFFLHSAMGSYTRDRSDSISSEDSAETTKPAASFAVRSGQEEQDNDEEEEEDGDEGVDESVTESAFTNGEVSQSPLHKRHLSTDSISTLATFMTATEGDRDSGDEDVNDNSALDDALLGMAPPPQLGVPPGAAGQRDSGVAMSPVRHIVKRAGHDTTTARNGVKPALLASLVAAGATDELGHLGLLLSPAEVSIAGRPLGLQAQDQVLVRALALSLEKVCVALKETESGQYDGKLLRRRLDEARRVLDGVEDGAVAAATETATRPG